MTQQWADPIVLLPLGFACAGIGGLGAWVIAHFGEQLHLVDHPNSRSSHSVPVPKGGGVGIWAAFSVSTFLTGAPLSLILSGSALALLGFLSDRIHISPKIRLIVQITAASISTVALDLPPLVILPAAVFIVGTANFFNFMDGINGIGGLTGIVAFSLVGAFAFINTPSDPIGPIVVCVSAACLGFLPFNLPRARVFMGDVGSILLGFLFGYVVVALTQSPMDFLCLSSFLWPFYIDELSTMVVRLRAGENLLHAHRRHYYQLLANESGYAHWEVSCGYALAQLIVGLCTWRLSLIGYWPTSSFLVIVTSMFCWLSFRERNDGPQE